MSSKQGYHRLIIFHEVNITTNPRAPSKFLITFFNEVRFISVLLPVAAFMNGMFDFTWHANINNV